MNKKEDIGKSLNLETLADHLRRRKALVTRSIPRRKPRVEEERTNEENENENEEREKNGHGGNRAGLVSLAQPRDLAARRE